MILIKVAVLFLALVVAAGIWGTWKRLNPPAFCRRCGTILKGAPRCPSCGKRA